LGSSSDSPYATDAGDAVGSSPDSGTSTQTGAAPDGGAGGYEAFDNRDNGFIAAPDTGRQEIGQEATADSRTEPSPAPDGGAGGGEAFDNPDRLYPGQPTTDAATTEESTDGPTAEGHEDQEPTTVSNEEAPDANDQGPRWENLDEEPTDGDLRASDLQDKSREEIRALADEMGLQPYGQPGVDGEPRKWRDPETGQQRLRIDEGHVDKTTGEPYNDPKAAAPHVHGYDHNGNKIVDPDDGNPHFPLI
jgi:hypothetical protein